MISGSVLESEVPRKSLENRSPGELGTALRSIFRMLRNAVPNSPATDSKASLGLIWLFIKIQEINAP